jgi:hypothetical protein
MDCGQLEWEEEMLVTIVIAAAVVLAVLLGYAATRPETFRVSRRQNIETAPDQIFPLIEDFRKWPAWSPYEKLDPTMKKTFSGDSSGKGAVYTWAGNSKAGEGRKEIVDAVSPFRVRIGFPEAFRGPQHGGVHDGS